MLNQLNEFAWNFRAKYSSVPEYEFVDDEIVQNYSPIKWDRPSLIKLGLSALVGAVLGVIVALSVNTALVEVSVSSAFSLYFGALFVLVGLIIVWRIVATSRVPLPDEDSAAIETPRRYLLVFASLNVITGLICCLVNPNTLLTSSTIPRLLIYASFGMSASFAMTFGIVDLLNLLAGFFRPESARPLVESVLQIYVVVATALSMGALFGSLFGFMDIDRSSPISSVSAISRVPGDHSVKLANFIDPSLCIPIGILCGGLAGVANEYIRRLEISFNKLDQPVEFDSDI